MLAGPINDNLAETALDAAKVMIGDMEVARSSGQVQRIVEATTNVFRGVSQYSSSSTTTDTIKVKSHLKSRAGDFCDTLTNTSAPATLPVGSASNDFLFSCQKVVQRQRSAIEDENDQVCVCSSSTIHGTLGLFLSFYLLNRPKVERAILTVGGRSNFHYQCFL